MTQFITRRTGVSSSIAAYYYYSNYPWDTKQRNRSISPKLLNWPWPQGCAAQHLHTWLSSGKLTAVIACIKDLMTAVSWEKAQRQVVQKDRFCLLQFLHTKNIPIWVRSNWDWYLFMMMMMTTMMWSLMCLDVGVTYQGQTVTNACARFSVALRPHGNRKAR